MATNQQAIKDLVTAKTALQAEVNAGASGETLTHLMGAIHALQTEIGALVLQSLAEVYVPQTNFFKQATDEAAVFVATLNKLKTALTVGAQVISAVATILQYVG